MKKLICGFPPLLLACLLSTYALANVVTVSGSMQAANFSDGCGVIVPPQNAVTASFSVTFDTNDTVDVGSGLREVLNAQSPSFNMNLAGTQYDENNVIFFIKLSGETISSFHASRDLNGKGVFPGTTDFFMTIEDSTSVFFYIHFGWDARMFHYYKRKRKHSIHWSRYRNQ